MLSAARSSHICAVVEAGTLPTHTNTKFIYNKRHVDLRFNFHTQTNKHTNSNSNCLSFHFQSESQNNRVPSFWEQRHCSIVSVRNPRVSVRTRQCAPSLQAAPLGAAVNAAFAHLRSLVAGNWGELALSGRPLPAATPKALKTYPQSGGRAAAPPHPGVDWLPGALDSGRRCAIPGSEPPDHSQPLLVRGAHERASCAIKSQTAH